MNLTYPQNGTLPTLIETPPADQAAIQYLNERKLSRSKVGKKTLVKEALRKRAHDEARNVKRDQWKRDLSGRANGTLDPWYGCFLFQEMIDYAINYTFPWSKPLLRWYSCVLTFDYQRWEVSKQMQGLMYVCETFFFNTDHTLIRPFL